MRILFNETEITKEVERLDSSVYVMDYQIGDFIYIASDFPFNHLFLKLGEVNAVDVTMKIEYWGTNWHEVVELRDETNGLKNDGYIEFTPNEDDNWSMDDSDEVGLTKVLYNKYWTRISFDDNLTADVELSFVGHKFSDDTDLFYEYPIFNDSNFSNAFKSGKTSWEEQAIKAADLICMDLKKKNVIIGAEQILERRNFIAASVCKTAEIIFTAFGNDYLEQRKSAREDYFQRLDLSQYAIDSDGDGILSPQEVRMKQGWLSR
jgi:hypothetical protein